MPSGITNQITKAQLEEQLWEMKEGETIEILTGDYIYRRSEKGFTVNTNSPVLLLSEVVSWVMEDHPNSFISVPEESLIKGFNLGWQSGGNVFLDSIYLKDGQVLVISDDCIVLYRNRQEAEENAENYLGIINRYED